MNKKTEKKISGKTWTIIISLTLFVLVVAFLFVFKYFFFYFQVKPFRKLNVTNETLYKSSLHYYARIEISEEEWSKLSASFTESRKFETEEAGYYCNREWMTRYFEFDEIRNVSEAYFSEEYLGLPLAKRKVKRFVAVVPSEAGYSLFCNFDIDESW